jgi:hypothetical protein
MKTLWIWLTLFTASALVFADKKGDGKFSAGSASSYAAKQTNDKVTVAVAAYDTEELAHTAFGKLDPNQYGVLPVLVILQNDTDQALRLDQIQVEYTGVDGRRLDATPAPEVQTLGGVRKPTLPTGSPIPRIKHKSPLSAWEIEGRAFAAKMLPAHESASGFFYFQTNHRPGSKFYLTGIREAATGKDLLYFEIPFK